MKKIVLVLLISFLEKNISSAQNKKIGNNVFYMEFIKTMSKINNDSNIYFTDLVERLMYDKRDSMNYSFFTSKGKSLNEEPFTYSSNFYDGKSNIIIDSVPALLFRDGSVKLFPEYNTAFWYKDKLGLVIKNGKYGFIDLSGKVIAFLKYDDAFPFYKGYASVKKDGKWNYIDLKGKTLFNDSIIFSYRPVINDKVVFMKENVKVKKNKSMLSENGSRTFMEFLNKLEKKQLKEGLIDINGNVLLEPLYDEISGYYKGGFMRIRNNGKTGIIDEIGEVRIPIDYDYISDYKDGLFLVKKNNKWGAINYLNKVIIPIEYDQLRPFCESLALFKRNGKIGYINIKNEVIIQTNYNYTDFGDFSKGLAVVKKNKKYGYINRKGKVVIPVIYEEALPFLSKSTLVKKDNKTFIINNKGRLKKKLIGGCLWKPTENLVRYAN